MRRLLGFVRGVPMLLGLGAAVATWIVGLPLLPPSAGQWVAVPATVTRVDGVEHVSYTYVFLGESFHHTDAYRGLKVGDNFTVWVSPQDPSRPQLAEPTSAREQTLQFLVFASVFLGAFMTLMAALMRWLPGWSRR